VEVEVGVWVFKRVIIVTGTGSHQRTQRSQVMYMITDHLRKNVGWVKDQISKLALEEAATAKQAEQARIKREQTELVARLLDRAHTRVSPPPVLPHKPPQYHQFQPCRVNRSVY
jgi:hypothetical protein